MTLRRILSILFTTVLPSICCAQGIIQIGIPQSEDQGKRIIRPTGRTKAVALPFWDDFSNTKTTFADPVRWEFGRSVTINDGMAIHPPSIKVATFDGVDSVGKPYNVNDVLAKGYADKLVSQAIDLTVVDVAQRNTVYLSYQYEMKGNGEIPDSGDRLLLLFLDQEGDWIPVDTVENDGSIEPDIFYDAIVPIADPRYYHPGFKFRIQNFARLSGPYDTWHVDYIYLNKGRSSTDLSFPDRTISEPLTSLFGVYKALPIDHFIPKADSMLTFPRIVLTNQRADQAVVGQPVNVVTSAFITRRDTFGVVTRDPQFGPVTTIDAILLRYKEFPEYTVTSLPDLTTFGKDIDSVAIELVVGMNSRDNVIKTPTEGDYVPEIYAPIDFRYSDTTRATFILSNKYAYDDGVAEYGAGLNQPGAQLAYEYNLVGKNEESLAYLEMYFPRFGDESSQLIELRIWNDLAENPVYTERATLQRSQENQFWLKKLERAVTVKRKFYIGWKQTAATIVAAGLDKNNDTGDRMYYNVDGAWLQNTSVHGSLMLRPVFGDGPTGEFVGLEDEKSLVVYPNPSSGSFRFGGTADKILIYDMTGRSASFVTETTMEETIVTLPNSSQGIYVMKVYTNGVVRTAKVLVR